jgi:hypothetical protein
VNACQVRKLGLLEACQCSGGGKMAATSEGTFLAPTVLFSRQGRRRVLWSKFDLCGEHNFLPVNTGYYQKVLGFKLNA